MAAAAPSPIASSSRQAVVGLVEGTTRPGRVVRFDPSQPDVTVVTGRATAALGRRLAIPSERVAYLAFQRGSGPVRRHGATRMRVHVAGGTTFEVLVDPDATKSPLGFWAGASEDDEVAEYFFYAHGVMARERVEPLGTLLVRQGSLSPARLDEAVLLQQADQAVTIGQILVENETVTSEAVDTAAEMQRRKKMRIGEILVEEGFATDKDIEAALGEQKKRRGKRLGEVLVDMGAITEVDLALALANKFDIEFLNLEETTLESKAMREVPRQVVERWGVLPIKSETDELVVAISDPLCVEAIEAIRMHQPKRVVEVLATKSQLARVVKSFLERGEVRTQGGVDALLREAASDEATVVDDHETAVDASDSAVIKLVNQIIIDGYRRGASDIHIEPNGRRADTRIRFRIDGRCVVYRDVPPALRAPLVARLKIMARLDIAERRKPQDGKIRFRVQDKQIELRVATLPTVANNEDVVMRILANNKPLPLRDMGLSAKNLAALKEAIGRPYGLVLCVGPTGSGKTTTLHSALGQRNVEGTKIWTAEDPVEITQAGLRQVQVNPKIGFTFAAALRSFLRADPDIIMVGEMRDVETATIGIEASLTGHLVMSTLHTNSAPETVTRLVDMGIDPFSFSDALLAVLAQRLVRRLCRCRETAKPDGAEWRSLVERYGEEAFVADFGSAESRPLFRAVGCRRCQNTGYKGRLALHELLVNDGAIAAAIQRKAPADEVRQLATQAGMRTLLQDGIAKVLAGETDLAQVLGVCSR